MHPILWKNKCNYLLRIGAFPLCNFCARSICLSKSILFAGHSKWSNIKHIKAAKDGEKAILFTKLSRQIRLALQEGGSPDPALNLKLKSAIEQALRKNMPIATINNNIKKFGQNRKELKRYRMDLRYKQKIFMVCVIYTDNFPGVKMDIASILKKTGVNIIDSNNIFEEIGIIEAFIEKKIWNGVADKMIEDAILFGAEDIEIINVDHGHVNFFCNPLEVMSFKKIIESNGYFVENTELIYIPKINVELSNEELLDFEKFLNKIKTVPGVEEVYDNIKEQC